MEHYSNDPYRYKDETTVRDIRNITILSYGSLVNDPAPINRPTLRASRFQSTNISLPVALSRKSRGDRITAIIDNNLGEPKPVYYAVSNFHFLPNARNNLAGREGIRLESNGYDLTNIFYMKKKLHNDNQDPNEKTVIDSNWLIRISND